MTTYIKFTTQKDIRKFITDNDVDVDELDVTLEVGVLYKIVDDREEGFWIEEV